MDVVIVQCGKSKLDRPAAARDLYTGGLFRAGIAYADRFGIDRYILSAKFGLVHESQLLQPYDVTLDDLNVDEAKAWTLDTAKRVRDITPEGARIVVLASASYCAFVPHVTDTRQVSMPLEGRARHRAPVEGPHHRRAKRRPARMTEQRTTCTRRLEWDMAHRVPLHESKCKHLHGHRYVAEVTFEADALTDEGFVVDFGIIKRKLGAWIDDMLDHNTLVSEDDKVGMAMAVVHQKAGLRKWAVMKKPPTAENIAEVLFDKAVDLFADDRVRVVSVVVHETPNCAAEFRR